MRGLFWAYFSRFKYAHGKAYRWVFTCLTRATEGERFVEHL
jgi:hypothetical protein